MGSSTRRCSDRLGGLYRSRWSGRRSRAPWSAGTRARTRRSRPARYQFWWLRVTTIYTVVRWWNGSKLSFLGLWDGSLGSSRGGGEQASMAEVSCTSVRFCEAVGRLGVISSSGSRWGRLTSPPEVEGTSVAVSCVAAGECVVIQPEGGQGTGFDRLSAGRRESGLASRALTLPTSARPRGAGRLRVV